MGGSRKALILVSFLVAAAGCERPAQPPQQHAELRRLNSSGIKITPQVIDSSPLRFEEISVSVVGPNNSTLGARSNWHFTDSSEQVHEFLKSKVTTARPELAQGLAMGLVLRSSYFNESGVATGTDDLVIKIGAETNKGNVTFKTLGVGGRVARIDVEIKEILWQSQGQETNVLIKRE
jgi:hypothetical protein